MKIRLPLNGRLQRHRARRERGQAIIEMALVMSILLILSFGMVDFGIFMTGHIMASNCSREAARKAVVREVVPADFCSSDHMLVPLFESAPLVMTPGNYVDADSGSEVTATVTATYRWKVLAPLINAFSPGTPWNATITSTTESTMRMEGRKP